MLKVIIIDDDDIMVFLQRKLFHRCGMAKDPLTFKAAPAAIEFLKNEDINQHFLILLDINMPGMNGWQFLDILKEIKISKNVFVIMVTSSIDGYDKEKAGIYSNVIDFMEKPVSIEDCNRIKEYVLLKEFFPN
ncbi:MAG: response regulator [Gillisia sp.]|nr:response regulator [Gillisia sp.]